MLRRRWTILVATAAAAFALAALVPPSTQVAGAQVDPGIFRLDHLIFIVQENRSFDHYFGTFPGADGLPYDPTVGRLRACIHDPILKTKSCTYHTTRQRQLGGPHNWISSATSVNGGRMNGFLEALPPTKRWCADRDAKACKDFVGPGGLPTPIACQVRRGRPATSEAGTSKLAALWSNARHLLA